MMNERPETDEHSGYGAADSLAEEVW